MPFGDADALAAPIVELLGDRDAAPAIRRCAPAPRVLARYGIDRLVNDIAALYRELLTVR